MEIGPNVDPKCVWLLKIDGEVTFSDCSVTPLEHVFNGVCISKEGFILTTLAGMKASTYDYDKLKKDKAIEVATLDDTKVQGRTVDSEFKRLSLLWEDDDSDLMILKDADDNTTDHEYVKISSVEVNLDSKLVSVGIQGDQPFSSFNLYAPAPIQNAPTPILPLYGHRFSIEMDTFRNRTISTTPFGTPIFDQFGLVGIIARPVDDFTFATPVDAAGSNDAIEKCINVSSIYLK